ncbi:cholesterol transporter ABCA5-like isoform X2 [Oratosquilla oratoria]|uniref:cholesterol transporter ABCA5-like isoform X2 n=1 Tax=Oratosquilla oratoria TaxID=337810 RepID=UPI003F76C2C3
MRLHFHYLHHQDYTHQKKIAGDVLVSSWGLKMAILALLISTTQVGTLPSKWFWILLLQEMLAWFLIYDTYVLILAIICVIILPLAKVFQKADLFLLFLLFLLYGSSAIVFALMLTPFFNKAKVAGIVGNLTQIAFSLLYYLQVYLGNEISSGAFWALGLLSPCAFSLAIDKVIMFDFAADGLNWTSLWEGPGLPFAGSLIMISVDIILYFLLALYFDNVIPSEYGTKRKFWFIFSANFWRRRSMQQVSHLDVADNNGYELNGEANPDFEPVPVDLRGKEAVKLDNIQKTFKSRGKEPVEAVKGVSLNIYEGQITAIIGHNGAGKTTLFNILTGMVSPSRGSAEIFGLDIRNPEDLAQIRQMTGVCPQQDILFLRLTPREHLRFYARIRGICEYVVESMVEQTLRDVDLLAKADTKSEDLSGGQKRKLSIGIALIGDPHLIFLDEPTAGVDAYSRRHLWQLLKRKKEGKVILLTTHFMDEADLLADRKAIMSQGLLRCCGSSFFLKKKFGVGYHLTLVVKEEKFRGLIEPMIKSVVQDAELVRCSAKELSYILPPASSIYFPSLFEVLDGSAAKSESTGLQGYGISMTTLEEVFLALHEENEGGELQDINSFSKKVVQERSASSSPLHTSPLGTPDGDNLYNIHKAGNDLYDLQHLSVEKSRWRAFKALVKVRVLNIIREFAAVFFLIVMPLVFTIGSIAVASSASTEVNTLPKEMELIMNTDMYGSSLPGTLTYNGTTEQLDQLDFLLTKANIKPEKYNGNYSSIFPLRPHFAAINVNNYSTESPFFINTTIRYNQTFSHALPILVNIIDNTLFSLTANVSAASTNNWAGITVSSEQLPKEDIKIEFDSSSFFAPFLIGFVFTMLPAGLTIELVNDRQINARNLLRLNGVGFNVYFLSFLVVLGALYMIEYTGLFIVIAAFDVKSLTIPGALASLALLYFLYMPASLLFSSVASYMYDKQETARQSYPSIATSVGMITYSIVAITDATVETNSSVPFILHCIFSVLIPFYTPFGILYYIMKIYIKCSLIYGTCEALSFDDYMTKEIIVMFVATVLQTPIFYILLRIVDSIKFGGSALDALGIKAHKKDDSERGQADIVSVPEEDDDVKYERIKVAEMLKDPNQVTPALIYNLGKTYKKGEESTTFSCKGVKKSKEHVAVKSISLEVKAGEVFGLLGPNGAGKTTTLKIITAEEAADRGRVQICGEEIRSSLSQVFETLGYCPQHDALWRSITVKEHIETYAEIRGIAQNQVNMLIDMYIKGLEIEEHKDKPSKNCSGGTKRKISYIISSMGSQVVLMDEPSTGMDPKSKRFLWNSIIASFKGDRGAILTTHSMEEADALCSRVGIMVKGSLRCIGSCQHLKNKYGGGYKLEIKVKGMSTETNGETSEDKKKEVHQLIKDTFYDAEIDEEFGDRIIYKISQHNMKSLGKCFAVMEKGKSESKIEEYSLSQTTLEQVFLKFARLQEEDTEEM